MKLSRIFAAILLFASPSAHADNWPQWRGANVDGTSGETDFPLKWSATENIRWKVALPGVGNSSPVIWGDQVILTASSGESSSQLHVLSYDRRDGKLRWQRDLFATPGPAPFSMFPPERGHAASTVCTDGRFVVALFGSGEWVGLNMDGQPQWIRSLTREYGTFQNDYGIAASPILAGDSVYVQIDHGNGSYLLAVDVKTGKNRWKVSRPVYDNWSSPVIHGEQVICLGTRTIIGYDQRTGAKKWSLDGVERLCATTPIVRHGMLYVVSGPSGANLAIDLSTTPPKVVWTSRKTGPFIPSAVLVGEWYIVSDDQGFATCYEAKTGKEQWRERLGGGRMRPSPVSAGNRVYFTALDGTTVVVQAGAEFEVLAKNALNEEVAASPALAVGDIFMRGSQHLWCIGMKK